MINLQMLPLPLRIVKSGVLAILKCCYDLDTKGFRYLILASSVESVTSLVKVSLMTRRVIIQYSDGCLLV